MTRQASALAFVLLAAVGCGDSGNTGAGAIVIPGTVCIDFCDQVVVECDALQIGALQCRNNCQLDVDAAFEESNACGEGFEAFYECVTALTCEEVESWRDGEPPDDYPCLAAVEAANEACDPSST